jgi:LytS/YehU family sensor histidine kinase
MSYLVKTILVLAITFFPVYLIATLISKDEDTGAVFAFFNAACQFFLTMPVTWFLFKRHLKGNEELYVLKKELDQTHANFDFLRSQINPHFLFNAMNTLYGTAIQENAERTSEAIQKLSDMMRFMLQENMQDKISLSREIDYLKNYIDLQKLRTDPSPSIKIDTEIEQQVNGIQIAPMLLIPFVENAFKHGISFRESSHIKVILEVKDKTVYFDVFNSKHPRPENDPEKGKSGIGLNNVKQRLQLLYKGKHDLVIRETAKDFFVHLTMHLS